MSSAQWHQFLQNSATQYPLRDISPLLIDETTLCDLSHLGLLQIQGADALTFLQGQVTNDVKQLDGHHAHYTGYCNPKGRMLALFLAFSLHDRLHLQMPKELTESITKRLKMYVMRSKVEIQDVSDTIIKFGLNGPHAPELLGNLFSQVPQNNYELVATKNATLLKLPGNQPRFEILTDIANAPAIWNTLTQQAKPVGATYWEWLEIQAGIPDVTMPTQEEFVPQMLNLDLLGGINFKKGCYTGQEIVARTHYLGAVKRRTHLAHIGAEVQPAVGTDVHNAQNSVVGKIVRSASAPAGGFDVLAEIRLESLESEQLTVNGTTLELQPLPYALKSESTT